MEIMKKQKKNTIKSNSGQKLWVKAKKIIPGGNMLLSKRPEMFLPDNWPSYFSKSKGCYIWGLDKKKYTDLSIMGVGTNILGYSNEEVDSAVLETVKKGNLSSLNCPEEVELVEKLLKLHPWAGMAKLVRTGGEANALAIRIGRAYSGKDKVAICGYHGWHDWYLSSNINKKNNLDDLLLPGLVPAGVPKKLKGLTIPFKYNDLDSFFSVIKNNDIGIIKMEVSRSTKPSEGYLETIRKVATKKGIILIFDECTSGFREANGGIHKNFKVYPDIAIFGKALGNGYAINSIIGRKEVMQAAQKSFISSTFWTERIGPTAAIKTLEIMKREKSWKIITSKGRKIKNIWMKISKDVELPINISGLDAIAKFSFISKDNLKYKTYLTQEMLKKNILASNSIYVSISHTDEILKEYEHYLRKIFYKIKDCENGDEIDNYLETDVCHSDFQRLN